MTCFTPISSILVIALLLLGGCGDPQPQVPPMVVEFRSDGRAEFQMVAADGTVWHSGESIKLPGAKAQTKDGFRFDASSSKALEFHLDPNGRVSFNWDGQPLQCRVLDSEVRINLDGILEFPKTGKVVYLIRPDLTWDPKEGKVRSLLGAKSPAHPSR